MDDRIPPFLTVEEASRLLKIGRTKAYLLTKEWRATGGRSGLPVVDLGDVLRVPGPAIERMLGTGLGAAKPNLGKPAGKREPAAPPPASVEATPDGPAAESAEQPAHTPDAPAPKQPASARTRRPRRRSPDQLPLFQPLSPTNPKPDTPTTYDPEPTTHP